MKAKTREATIAELAAKSAEGKRASSNFTALLKRLVKIPPQPRAAKQAK